MQQEQSGLINELLRIPVLLSYERPFIGGGW